ncbi:hypothetical protein LWI29_025623 [Acer saccharum]|uniref:Uncharacterized protein n=1 Tax=Acer saccharum TaxID=4024 RepID=A0AA39S7Q3_ACESA|nr:hypothetical protein LWI29_025623 [Acer saccharum]
MNQMNQAHFVQQQQGHLVTAEPSWYNQQSLFGAKPAEEPVTNSQVTVFLPSFTSPASYNGSAGRLQAAAPATSIRSQAPAAAAVDQIPLHRSVLCQQPSSEFHMPVVQPTTCMPQCEQTAADTTSRHKMITRSKTGSLKPKTFLSTSNISSAVSSEPKTVKQALSDPKWYSAMQEEFRALQSNNTCLGAAIELLPKIHPVHDPCSLRVQ